MYITYFIIFHKLIIFITKNNISRIKFKKLELKNRCVKNCTLIIKQLNSIRGVNFLEFRANFEANFGLIPAISSYHYAHSLTFYGGRIT